MNRPRAEFLAEALEFTVNGRAVRVRTPRIARLADVLRDELGLTGTKIGCNAGDCGACTVLLDGRQVCACLTALGQVEDRDVRTVEGLAKDGKLSALQVAFQNHGAAQCGICTPGMLLAAGDLLSRVEQPDAEQVKEALGGVLCRCTGYQKIIEAVLDAANCPALAPSPAAGKAVGARAGKVDRRALGDQRMVLYGRASATSVSASARHSRLDPCLKRSCSSRAPPRRQAAASSAGEMPLPAQTPVSMIG